MPEITPKKKGKSSKSGKNSKKPTHMRYNAEGRRDKNKVRAILKQIKKHPLYKCPESANKEVKTIVKIALGKLKPQTA